MGTIPEAVKTHFGALWTGHRGYDFRRFRGGRKLAAEHRNLKRDGEMAKTVWCVFERLPHESCPGLSAVCASAEVAEEMVALGRREKELEGAPESEWTVAPWTVLDRQVAKIDRADQISHVLDPMRGALAYPAAAEAAPRRTRRQS
jgi:hypothetical protein